MSKEKVLAMDSYKKSLELMYAITTNKNVFSVYSFTTAATAAPTSIPHALPSIFIEST